MPAFKDMTGQKIGRWKVLYRDGTHKFGGAQWRCRCSCGNEKTVRAQSLARKDSRSCGCLNNEVRSRVCIERNTTHGHAKRGHHTRTYRIWLGLSIRHLHEKYKDITVCDRWSHFENFLIDMGECLSEKHTIDRVDNSIGYEPSNCRWATMKEQQNNRTNNRKVTVNGITKNLQQWADASNIDRKTISDRLKRGWKPERAVALPPVRGRNQYSEL